MSLFNSFEFVLGLLFGLAIAVVLLVAIDVYLGTFEKK